MTLPVTAVEQELCSRCRREPAPNGFRRCARCRSLIATHRGKAQEQRRAAGLCRDCVKPAEPGRSRCQDHLDGAAESSRKYKAAHPKLPQVRAVNPVPVAQRCGSCRKREKRPGRATCVLCEEKRKAARLKKRLDSDARMVCTKCSLVAVPGKKRCERHLDMQRKASAKVRERTRRHKI